MDNYAAVNIDMKQLKELSTYFKQ